MIPTSVEYLNSLWNRLGLVSTTVSGKVASTIYSKYSDNKCASFLAPYMERWSAS
jgi:hypothetical protein